MDISSRVRILDRVADDDEAREHRAEADRPHPDRQGLVRVLRVMEEDRVRLEALPLDQAHRVERPAPLVEPQAVDRDDPGVDERAGDLGLALELLPQLAVAGQVPLDLLDDDRAVQLGVLRLEDLAEAPPRRSSPRGCIGRPPPPRPIRPPARSPRACASAAGRSWARSSHPRPSRMAIPPAPRGEVPRHPLGRGWPFRREGSAGIPGGGRRSRPSPPPSAPRPLPGSSRMGPARAGRPPYRRGVGPTRSRRPRRPGPTACPRGRPAASACARMNRYP
jgi:hypothetical protein